MATVKRIWKRDAFMDSIKEVPGRGLNIILEFAEQVMGICV